MSAHTFSFIVAYKHRPDRLTNLKRVLEWVSGFGGVEIIIVEQDKKSVLPGLSLKGFKYIYT